MASKEDVETSQPFWKRCATLPVLSAGILLLATLALFVPWVGCRRCDARGFAIMPTHGWPEPEMRWECGRCDATGRVSPSKMRVHPPYGNLPP